MLFISFSLDVIQQRVDHLHDGEQVILIENAAGEAVAYAGGGRPSEHIGHEHPSMPIEGSDVPARLGGDEFAVILNATRDAQAVEQWYSDLAARFAQLQAEQLPSLPAEAYCTISAGWAVIDKHQYANIDQQLEAADQALYRAKSQGRGRIIA